MATCTSSIEASSSTSAHDNTSGRKSAAAVTPTPAAQSAANAAAQQVLGSAFDPFNSYDPNFGWQQMAANMPTGAGQGPVSWQTDPAAMAAQQWGGGAPAADPWGGYSGGGG